MYCPECRESARFPWDHHPDCIEGLRHRLRLYEFGFALVLVVIILESVLILIAFHWMGALP